MTDPAPPVFRGGMVTTDQRPPRAADGRGPGQFTVGFRSAGEAHIETAEGLEQAVRTKLRQHTGLRDPLVLVLDLSSPITGDREIAAVLYGPVTTTMLNPVTVLGAERDRAKGTWPEPLRQQARPAAVLILRGIWLGCHDATAGLWLPPGTISPLVLASRVDHDPEPRKASRPAPLNRRSRSGLPPRRSSSLVRWPTNVYLVWRAVGDGRVRLRLQKVVATIRQPATPRQAPSMQAPVNRSPWGWPSA